MKSELLEPWKCGSAVPLQTFSVRFLNVGFVTNWDRETELNLVICSVSCVVMFGFVLFVVLDAGEES